MMSARKGFFCLATSVMFWMIGVASAVGADTASIDYKQTMTIVMRETDVDDWLPTYSRYFRDIAMSPSGSHIAFLARLGNYVDRRLYLANGDGTGLVDLTGNLPSGININNVYYLLFSGDGARLFFFGSYGADVIYCDVLTVNKSCYTALTGAINPGDVREPFSLDRTGTTLYFKHSSGEWDDANQRWRQGLFHANVGGSAVELMNIAQLPGGQNINYLRYLGASEGGSLLFTWFNSEATAPAQTSMYQVAPGSAPARMPPDEAHWNVWSFGGLKQRIIDADGEVALYSYTPVYGQPTSLYRLDLATGDKSFILATTDGNAFDNGPALSPAGSIARVRTLGYNETRIDLSSMDLRDTWSYWFGESGCVGESNLTDISTNDRFYYMGSDCPYNDMAKIYRVDMMPDAFDKTPNIDAITFSRSFLPFDDSSTLTITASVKEGAVSSKAIEWVKIKSLVEGRESPEWLIYDPLSYDAPLYDDGTQGDVVAGDGVYTNNAIRTNSISNFYSRYTLPHDVGIRVVAKDVDDNYVMADTSIPVSTDDLVVDRSRNDWRVCEIYIATMSYAPDHEGLQYWVNQIATNSAWNPTKVAQSFFDQPLVQAQYPLDQGDGPFIDALYQNIFGRAVDEAGYTYWLDELESGRIQRNQMVMALIEGGWANADAAGDMARFGNQVEVGLAFAAEQDARGIVYSNLSTLQQTILRQIGSDLLRDVTDDPATRDQAIARIPGLLDGL
jgi:hypothetical protein